MSNETIRTAAANDFAATEAGRVWVLTDEAAEEWPHLAGQLLQRLDTYQGWRMAPVIAIDGRETTGASFVCFPDDVREVAL